MSDLFFDYLLRGKMNVAGLVTHRYAADQAPTAYLNLLKDRSYETMLKQWRIDHQRRRNLWKAMDLLGLK